MVEQLVVKRAEKKEFGMADNLVVRRVAPRAARKVGQRVVM